MILPPSPALSACDSLDGIDDLDAFLAAQGTLSHFPTPPVKKDLVVEVIEVLEDLAKDEDALIDYHYIATTLAQEANMDNTSRTISKDVIEAMLRHAALPSVITAIALNILAELQARGSLKDTPADLLLAAALALAVSYTNDEPPEMKWWSRHVCNSTWTATRINKTILEVLESLDFRLHAFSTADRLQDALSKLGCHSDIVAPNIEDAAAAIPTDHVTKEPLRLLVNGDTTLWQHGQLTPDSCASPVAAECRLPLADWLPLL